VRGRRKHIGEAVELEGDFMGKHTIGSGPEERDHELLARSGGKVPQTVDAVGHPVEATGLDPVGQEAITDARLASLAGREIATLSLSDEVERSIIGPMARGRDGWIGSHTAILTCHVSFVDGRFQSLLRGARGPS
jgi:hypothetical protein